jgi:hypothetical protein
MSQPAPSKLTSKLPSLSVAAASKALAIQESFRIMLGSSRKMVGAQGSAKVGNADTASFGAREESEAAQTFVSSVTTGPSRGDGGSSLGGLGGGHGSVAKRRQAAADSSTGSRVKSPDREDADRPENTLLPLQVILPTAGLAAAAAASGPAIVRNASTSEALVVEGEEKNEEEESEEVQNLWQSIFTFFPMIWSAITMFAAELIEMGLLQYLALILIPIWWGIKWLMDAFTDQPVLPNAPPPPPMLPPFYVRAQDATWDYADRRREQRSRGDCGVICVTYGSTAVATSSTRAAHVG